MLNYLLRNNRIGDRDRKYLHKNLNCPFVLNTQQYCEIKNKNKICKHKSSQMPADCIFVAFRRQIRFRQSVYLLVSFLTPNFSYQAVASPYLFNKKLVTNIVSISIVRDGQCEGNITKITFILANANCTRKVMNAHVQFSSIFQ